MNKNLNRNFLNTEVALGYNAYNQNETGKIIDRLEKQILLQHLKKIPKECILDLGCGTCHWTQFFTGFGFQVTAVDNSEAMLEI